MTRKSAKLVNPLGWGYACIKLQYPVIKMTEAAQRLFHPDTYSLSLSKSENTGQFVVLPDSSSSFVGKFPELKPFLRGQAKANPANFLHMAFAYDQSLWFARDVLLLFPGMSNPARRRVREELGFAMVHDLGKVFVGRDFDESQHLVYPANIFLRPSSDNGYHWAHPTFSAYALQYLAEVAPGPLRDRLAAWSRQSLLHHRDYMPFALGDNSSLLHSMTREGWLAHFIFSVSDVAVAMKMERPQGQGNHVDEKISQVLLRKHLSDNNLRLFFGDGVDSALVRPYLLASCLQRLAVLRESYSPQDCIQPSGFVAGGFRVDVQTQTRELDALAAFGKRLWVKHERALLAPIERMDRAGVLQLR